MAKNTGINMSACEEMTVKYRSIMFDIGARGYGLGSTALMDVGI